jgi:hypothetical protein
MLCLVVAVNLSIVTTFLYRFLVIKNTEFNKMRIFIRIMVIYIAVLTPMISCFVYAITYDPIEVEREMEVSVISVSY